MAETGWAALRRMFVEEYEELRRQLSRRLGSSDIASDALHDTFLQLTREDRGGEEVRHPKRYLLRMALNLASARVRTERRRAGIAEMRELELALEIPDSAPGPAETAEASSDLRRLRELLDEMPRRRRDMVLAVLVEGVTHRELAERHGLSIRMIQIEIRKATDQLSERFGEATIIRFASRRDMTSDE